MLLTVGFGVLFALWCNDRGAAGLLVLMVWAYCVVVGAALVFLHAAAEPAFLLPGAVYVCIFAVIAAAGQGRCSGGGGIGSVSRPVRGGSSGFLGSRRTDLTNPPPGSASPPVRMLGCVCVVRVCEAAEFGILWAVHSSVKGRGPQCRQRAKNNA